VKDSGESWVGEIPAEWTVLRLCRCGYIRAGYPFDAEKFGVKGFPLIRIRDLMDGPIQTYYDGPWVKKAAVYDSDLLV